MKTHGRLVYIPAKDAVNAEGLTMGAQRAAWGIQCSAHVMQKLKRWFPRAQGWRTGTMILFDTAEVCRDLEMVLFRYPLEVSDEHLSLLHARSAAHRESEEQVARILAGERLPLELVPGRPPREYQEQAAALCRARGRLLLADDVGLGKSMSGLLVLAAPDALPAVVVTLTHLPTQWIGQLTLTWPNMRGAIVRQGRPYDLTRQTGGHPPDVIVLSYSKLAGWADTFAEMGVGTVIFDECQELRREGSPGSPSLKYAAAGRIADQARYRIGLSATPVYNYGGEMFNVLNVIAPDALGSREEFTREWGVGDSRKLGVRDPRAFGTWLRDEGLMLRRTRADVARELPDVIRVTHTCDTDEKTLTRLAGDAIALANFILDRAGTASDVWQASGQLDWRMRMATGVAKAPYVAEFVRMLLESGEPVVLFGWHRDVYDAWAGRLDDFKPAFYTGEESPTQKLEAQRRFLDGETDLLIMSLRAGAGLDGLQERAKIAVFGELDWSPGIHDQCIGRLNRDGQTDPVVAYFLVAEDGSDPVVAEALNLKRMQSEPIRDPDAQVFNTQASQSDRIRQLAAALTGRTLDEEESAA